MDLQEEPDNLSESIRNIVYTIWVERGFLLKVIALFITFGLVLAFVMPIEYKSEVQLMPELQGKAAGGFRQFSALAEIVGIELSNSGTIDAVRPDLYPNVIQSTPFILYLLNQSFKDKENNKQRLHDFLLKEGWSSSKEKVPCPPIQQEGKLIRLTKEQKSVVEDVKDRIISILDKRTGIITITVKMPDPNVAAQAVEAATIYLTNYVDLYRTEKARKDAVFIQSRVKEAHHRYGQAEFAWSKYRDEHRYLVSQVADIQGRKLEAEYIFSQTLYNELNRQLEQAKLRVQEEKPVMKILEPAQIPPKRSEPKRTVLVISFTILGMVIGLLLLFIKKRFFAA